MKGGGKKRDTDQATKGLSRREMMAAAGAACIASSAMLWGAVPSATAGPGQGQGQGNSPGNPNDDSGTIRLVNGKFVDYRGEVASSLVIKNGRIADVGGQGATGPGAEVINLNGATVIP